MDQRGVTFRWKDRSDHNRSKVMTLAGSEFVRRYLRHVLPSGLRSIRYTASAIRPPKAKRQRIQIHTGMPFELNSPAFPECRSAWRRAALPNLRPPDAVDRIDPVTVQAPKISFDALRHRPFV